MQLLTKCCIQFECFHNFSEAFLGTGLNSAVLKFFFGFAFTDRVLSTLTNIVSFPPLTPKLVIKLFFLISKLV